VTAVQLKITLQGVRPPVWRRLVVPMSLTLGELHQVFQTAMGWTDSHLHAFDIGGATFGDLEDLDGSGIDESRARLSRAIGKVSKFRYEYDFGDGWVHDVAIERTDGDAAVPRCLAGRRACPPEDCGGPGGYDHLLKVLADPAHEEHTELAEWVGAFDPAAFDVAETNDRLRGTSV
jgi:hypothetical protein